MMILLVALSSHKSGSVIQLTKNIEQERTVLLAQAAINEILATAKSTINDPKSEIGARLHQFWKNRPPCTRPTLIFSRQFTSHELVAANKLAAESGGPGIEAAGSLSVTMVQKLKAGRPSYIGFLEIIGRAGRKSSGEEIAVKERREIKLIDLSDPFIDKYALFVKTFCRSINHPQKRIIVQGIRSGDPTKYSFACFGNRSYPTCPEFPDGSKGDKEPPVIFDLDFREDRHLLGPFYQPGSFQMVDNQHSRQSDGNLFFVNPPFDFSSIKDSFSLSQDFHHTPELTGIYKSIVDSSRKYADTEGTLGFVITRDFKKAGGNPAGSEVFRSLVSSLMRHWKYHYGYSDYLSVTGAAGSKAFTNEHPFSGIISYFEQMSTHNPQRTLGGRMPVMFGVNRDTPLYVEGPVFLRFFKISFVDQTSVTFNLHGGHSLDVPFPPVPMHYEKSEQTFAGKKLATPVDSRTDKLMSMPVEHFSINNFFFGAGTQTSSSPSTVRGGIEIHNVFPLFDETLQSFAHIYQTADDFCKERIKATDNGQILYSDGMSLIMDTTAKPLDLSMIEEFRGRGRIVIADGGCVIGNLSPGNADQDSLSIYLMSGRFKLNPRSDTARIRASLIATTCFTDNSTAHPSVEGGVDFAGKNLEITGNLFVDNLFELKTLPNNGTLKILHDPMLYFPEYPVRISVSPVKSMLAVDYNAE